MLSLKLTVGIIITAAFPCSSFSATASSRTTDGHSESVSDKAETKSSTTAVEEGDNHRKRIEKKGETTNTVSTTIISSRNEGNKLKQRNDLDDRLPVDSYDEEKSKNFITTPGKLGEAAAPISIIEEMPKMLKQNLKKLEIHSGTVNSSKRSKSLKQTKLKVNSLLLETCHQLS